MFLHYEIHSTIKLGGMKVKKHIVISLILLLAISTQAFASPKNNMPVNDEKVEVSEEAEVTEKIDSVQPTTDSVEKLEAESSDEMTNNPNGDNSTNADKLCWVCTKYIYGGGGPCKKSIGETDDPTSSNLTNEVIAPSDCYVPKYRVCVDGYWSPNCRTQ